MRRVAKMLMVTFLFVTFISFGTFSADFGIYEAKVAEKGEVINDTCPVMGGKVDNKTPYKLEYGGETIGFCCPDCVGKFKADPETYMAKLKKKCIIKCPKCGAEIDVMKECKKAKMGAECPMMD